MTMYCLHVRVIYMFGHTRAAEKTDRLVGGGARFCVFLSPSVIEETETGRSQLGSCEEQRIGVLSAYFDGLLANVVAARWTNIPSRKAQAGQGVNLGRSE